jgi:phosphotriesterase-related protein
MSTAELSPAHIGSGQVMTVLGPVPASGLGVTLMHEHLLNDCRCWWNKPKEPSRSRLACEPVNAGILGELRMDPFVNLDNCRLDDERLTIAELAEAVALGCRTVVDPTCAGIGRDPRALARIAEGTGLNIVTGGGFYLQASHPARLAGMSADDIADEIVAEALVGIGDSGVRIGLIGEIGVSADFTPDEEKSLRGAARAQGRCGLPLMVHLPGWYRHGHRVLDIVAAEGGLLRHTILCHMNPSGADTAYQTSLAARGAFLGFDMIGMDFWYADQGVQCPSDEQNAAAIAGLIDAGFVDNLLLSQDVFLKMMLTRYGGFGYAYLQRHFLPRLQRHGVADTALTRLMIDNPRRVFSREPVSGSFL